MIDSKTKELAATIDVSDQEIKDYYQRYQATHFKTKELTQAYQQIKWLLVREKQRKVVGDWVKSLKGKSDIHIDYQLLGIRK